MNHLNFEKNIFYRVFIGSLERKIFKFIFKNFRVEQQKNSYLMEMNDVRASVEELTMEKVSFSENLLFPFLVNDNLFGAAIFILLVFSGHLIHQILVPIE